MMKVFIIRGSSDPLIPLPPYPHPSSAIFPSLPKKKKKKNIRVKHIYIIAPQQVFFFFFFKKKENTAKKIEKVISVLAG